MFVNLCAQNVENASKKVHFHSLGQGDYKAVIAKWDKMDEDLIGRGILSADLNWTLGAKHLFYAHSGSLNMEDGSLLTSDGLRKVVYRLKAAPLAMTEGSFKPDREIRAELHPRKSETHYTYLRYGHSSMEAWL